MNSDFKDLRAKALEVIAAQKEQDDFSQWGNDIKRLVDELSIHQIELEYQNEELVRAQEEVQRKSDEFADLFDNAPVGHLILDRDHNNSRKPNFRQAFAFTQRGCFRMSYRKISLPCF